MIQPVIQPPERWQLFRTIDTTFRISKDMKLTYEGTETEAKKYIEENYKPIEFKVNDLMHTITFLAKED